jgi:hypothetical protein
MEGRTGALGYENRADIADLVGRYAHLADYGTVDEWVALFAEGARVARPGLELHGRDALTEYLTRRRSELAVRHQLFNVVVEGEGDEAHADCYAQVIEVGTTRVILTGRYRLRVIRAEPGWQIDEVRIEPDTGAG